MNRLLKTAAIAASVLTVGVAQAADPIKLAHVYGKTGPLEAYAAQLANGLNLGFEYATNGTNEIAGRKIEIVDYDTQLKADRARSLLAQAYEDGAVLAFGPIASPVAIAALPVAAEYEKIVIPEGAADAITGKDWNRYVFRIGRNSSQDAISNAVAQGGPGSCIATLAQDNAFGRDGVAAYKTNIEASGGKVVHQEYAPVDATDFTAPAQRIFDALKDRTDCERKFIFTVWSGKGNPGGKIMDLEPGRYGIKMAVAGNILPALVSYSAYPGAEGATYYYYEHPNNEVNDWLVKEHFKRYNTPPDFFTAQGMAEAMAVAAALKKTNGSTDTEDLIEALEGLTFQSPKGEMYIRPEDHQTMQPMYHFRVNVEQREDWFPDKTVTAGVPQLIREIPASEMNVPIQNKR